MRLVFTKRAGKMDELVAIRPDGSQVRIDCPKQGTIPHDMVHYAVESVLAERGFLSKLEAEGPRAMSREAAAEAVERLVETLQAEVWSGRVADEELLGLYALACETRGHAAAPVSREALAAIRQAMDRLAARWDAVAVGESLTLTFDPVA